MIEIHSIPKNTIDDLDHFLSHLAKQYKLPRSHEIIDENGVDGRLVNLGLGCKGFVKHSTTLHNLKSFLTKSAQYVGWTEVGGEGFFSYPLASKAEQLRACVGAV